MAEEVIELSVEETNKLRAELGLAPLRLNDGSDDKPAKAAPPESASNRGDKDEEVLELSVDDTNALRAKLGLPPLRDSSSSKKIQDANLVEKQKQQDQQKAEEREALEEDVQKGIGTTFTAKSLGEEESNDVTSWAAKLRKQKESEGNVTSKKKKKSKKDKSANKVGNLLNAYGESDLQGMSVSHAMSELEAGSTTVMTLADAPLLETNEHNPHIVKGLNEDANTPQLENVALADAAKQADGLKKKRQLELGMGRAGAYAGFDDDEFEELGGTGAPSRTARGQFAAGGKTGPDGKARKGFKIGTTGQEEDRNKTNGSDLFAMEAGKAISLEPMQADVQASDFMTEQEDLELRGKDKKKSKRKDKFDKKKKKKDKKEKRRHRRRQMEEDDEEESDEERTPATSSKTLLEELEKTAEDSTTNATRKRTRSDDEGEQESGHSVEPSTSNPIAKASKKKPEDKRAKYYAIMNKGNARTQQAFSESKQTSHNVLEDEPDDAFLNAALAKARRLKKLQGMGGTAKGAEAVVAAVQSMPDTATSSTDPGSSDAGITFSVDDTREFTRALQARSEQQSRKQKLVGAKKEKTPTNVISTVTVNAKEEPEVETVVKEEDNDDKMDVEDEEVDMDELAKGIKDDGDDVSNNFLDGTTGNTVAVGRGLAGVVNLFKQTGDLTRKNAGKEEMRGRAKDERTYEDYEALDLKTVVKIDDRHATSKDKEMASREVKLEYRDKHGRLLTRKEAYRDLCYQFHGHGSSKRKEEKKLKQMAREQAEARLASQQVVGSDGGPGTLGALKATQKATGKAFVVHKT